MFDNDGNLDIFERFIVDRDLPKHRRPQRSAEDSEDMMMSSADFDRPIRSRRGSVITLGRNNLAVWNTGSKELESFTLLQRLALWFLRLVTPKGADTHVEVGIKPARPRPQITVHEFFSSVKNSPDELSVVDERARGYEAALERARKTGQTALVEQLALGIDAARAETQLITMGLTKVLTEETLVEFVKKSPRGLALDWVKNFTRIIPDDVLATKLKCDARRIFDNYVVLHYDPDKKSWAETEAEREARKDPILFGVIEGKRALYYVGDWIDDYCDLTLDQIADVLGQTVEEATTEINPEDYGVRAG